MTPRKQLGETMKITKGYWRTRDGKKVRVIYTDAPGKYPVLGFISDESGELEGTLSWEVNGRYLNNRSLKNRDIVAPWKDPPEPRVAWIKASGAIRYATETAVKDQASWGLVGEWKRAEWLPDEPVDDDFETV